MEVTMWLVGPFRYSVRTGDGGYTVTGEDGRRGFSAPATRRGPKIYVFSTGGMPVYIGQAVRGMAARLRDGFNADGRNGYHGYAWRRELAQSELSVWCLEGVAEDEWAWTLECIESELVFTYRSEYGQWPQYQTEIHFHQSSSQHRRLAAEVFGHFVGTHVEPAAQCP